jgi:hypothetical protein
MLEVTPAWTFTSQSSLSMWYGHVHLLPGRVLGQWVCLNRSEGRLVWQKRFFRPNTIYEVVSGVIIASETRSDGPWTLDFGCYGISLETGQLLWTSHARGGWGGFLRLLDFIPGFTNDLRDTPAFVRDGELVCASGRVLDVRTGMDRGRVSAEEVKGHVKPRSDTWLLYQGGLREVYTRVKLTDGRWLSHKASPNEESVTGFHLYVLGDDGAVRWHFDLAGTGYHIGGNYYSNRYAAPYLYLVVSEERQLRDVPGKPGYVVTNPAVYRLLTLDLNGESVMQDFRVDECKLKECRIEDVDETAVLVSLDGRQLRYYERRQPALP